MSLVSCFVIAALLLIRQIRRLPRRVMYPLWALAFFRLLVPFAAPTSWSLFNFTGGLVKRLVTIETITQGLAPASDAHPGLWTTMNSIGAVDRYVPVEYKTESLRQIFTTGAAVWAVVAAASIIAATILYSLTRKELKQAVRIRGGLYCSDLLLSPILTGLFRPRIILPPALDPDSPEGAMVIAHENVHKARLDNLWRLLAICVTCLHWFNPFAWILLKSFLADMELSCDEAVIRKLGKEERERYAGTLLRFAEDRRVLVSSAFGRSGVKVRITNVLNYRKLTLVGLVASSLLLLAVALVLITNPSG
jgi:beta-lactamase regulating signal transducer with metallopeptidase domain